MGFPDKRAVLQRKDGDLVQVPCKTILKPNGLGVSAFPNGFSRSDFPLSTETPELHSFHETVLSLLGKRKYTSFKNFIKTGIQNADFNGGEILDTATVRSGELFPPRCPGRTDAAAIRGSGSPTGVPRATLGFCPQPPTAPSSLDGFTNLGWEITDAVALSEQVAVSSLMLRRVSLIAEDCSLRVMGLRFISRLRPRGPPPGPDRGGGGGGGGGTAGAAPLSPRPPPRPRTRPRRAARTACPAAAPGSPSSRRRSGRRRRRTCPRP